MQALYGGRILCTNSRTHLLAVTKFDKAPYLRKDSDWPQARYHLEAKMNASFDMGRSLGSNFNFKSIQEQRFHFLCFCF